MRKLSLVMIVLCLALLVIGVPAGAQEDTHPLADMLALVPREAASIDGGMISYVDYAAIFSQRDGTYPENAAEYAEILADERGSHLFFANSFRLMSGLSSWVQYLNIGAPESLQLHGFEWFDIERALTFGAPPAVGNIVAGDFNPLLIRLAFAARDYTSEVIGDVEVLCWEEGCDQGQRVDVRGRHPGVIFGGDLGRREPVALLPDMLLNSASFETLSAMLDVQAGESASLMDSPEFQSLVAALTSGDWQVLQVNFVTYDDVMKASIPETIDVQPDDLGNLLPYGAAALADLQDGDDQISLVALAYGGEATAEAAALEVTNRLAGFDPSHWFQDFNVTVEEPRVFVDEETGMAVAIAALRYPLPSNEPDENGRLISSGMVYRTWINAIYRRQFYPIAGEIASFP